jgi:hypothetical protein
MQRPTHKAEGPRTMCLWALGFYLCNPRQAGYSEKENCPPSE